MRPSRTPQHAHRPPDQTYTSTNPMSDASVTAARMVVVDREEPSEGTSLFCVGRKLDSRLCATA